MSRPKSLFGRLRENTSNLIEDVAMATLIFFTISVAWAYAPSTWPRFFYYVALTVSVFGYFRYASPPPSDE